MAKTAAPSVSPRLKATYSDTIVKELQKELQIDNVNALPRIEKIIVASGIGKHKDDKHFHEVVFTTLRKITGQQPVDRIAKKSIAGFKIRAKMGSPIGVSVTLRGARMYEFLDRLINVALPRVRDFHGVGAKGFDKQGNYNLGITDQSIFPELTFEDTQTLHGLQITIVVRSGSVSGTKLLLEKFGMPFEKASEKGGR